MDQSKQQPQEMKDLEDQTEPEIEIQLSPTPSADSMLSSEASNNYDMEILEKDAVESHLSPSPSADSKLSAEASNNFDRKLSLALQEEVEPEIHFSPLPAADSKLPSEAPNDDDIEPLHKEFLDQAVNRVYQIMDRFGFDEAANHVYQTMERFGVEDFVFVMIPKDGEPLTGASDNLRESWEKYVSDNPHPPIQLEQFFTRQLAGVPSEVQGSGHSVNKDGNSGDVGGSSNVFQDPQGTS